MTKAPATFLPLGTSDDVFTAQKGTLRCTAIRLASGGLCLYSPVLGLDAAAWQSLRAFGQVTHLLAPNHYHNKGLAACSATFPDAKLCCTLAAMPRLEQQTGLSFEPLDTADIALPAQASFLEPDGLKTGEIWVQMTTADGALWIVTDAFCGPKRAPGTVVDTPEMPGTFPRFGIKDRAVYQAWIASQPSLDRLTTIVPCHGAVISGPDLGPAALQLVEDL
ncbi:hypothetical protein [uncultured Tateyamaria sp.]|uniref:hypothetical protein n=1 Tax=uncultured Tateyamaria sp. TaxID=455651 RepID=UPI002604E600|nr:hypothetical protein [uncultured Tateyamaria sp.]